eukprot:281402-Chlamydomonas_euryale.AAC.1
MPWEAPANGGGGGWADRRAPASSVDRDGEKGGSPCKLSPGGGGGSSGGAPGEGWSPGHGAGIVGRRGAATLDPLPPPAVLAARQQRPGAPPLGRDRDWGDKGGGGGGGGNGGGGLEVTLGGPGG